MLAPTVIRAEFMAGVNAGWTQDKLTGAAMVGTYETWFKRVATPNSGTGTFSGPIISGFWRLHGLPTKYVSLGIGPHFSYAALENYHIEYHFSSQKAEKFQFGLDLLLELRVFENVFPFLQLTPGKQLTTLTNNETGYVSTYCYHVCIANVNPDLNETIRVSSLFYNLFAGVRIRILDRWSLNIHGGLTGMANETVSAVSGVSTFHTGSNLSSFGYVVAAGITYSTE